MNGTQVYNWTQGVQCRGHSKLNTTQGSVENKVFIVTSEETEMALKHYLLLS